MDIHPPAANPSVRSLTRRRWLAAALQGLIILAVVAGFVALQQVTSLPERVDDQQTVVVGPTRFIPDSDASVRVVVQNFKAGQPIAGAQVKVSLQPSSGPVRPLFEGQTDASGSLPVSFRVPADIPATGADGQPPVLIVDTKSGVGQDQVKQPVTIERDFRLLLTSDKPLYQPGQTMHMRALALSDFDLTPARGASVDFLVEDPKGNKVYRKSVPASEYGIAAADFTLADMVNQGNYRLSVAIGNTRSEKTVEVRPYVLPKFAVKVTTDRTFYTPGQHVAGTVQADYFFGKPVAGGQVQVTGSVWDVQRTVAVDLKGKTDEKGTYQFGFELPAYFAGGGLEAGQAQFALEVAVIDQTDHAEQTSQTLPVAAQPLAIEAVAESGALKPGVENIIYILTSYPDGRPAPAKLQVRVNNEQPVELTSGEFGLTEFKFTPHPNTPYTFDLFAQDASGLTGNRQAVFQAEGGSDSVLLRADRAAYVVGETMNLTAFTPVQSGDVYLDMVKAGQTLSTRSTRVDKGKADFAVDVTPDLVGTLELHAYKVLLDGTIVRDTRLVVVDAPNDLAINVTADKETYLPGAASSIKFQTSGAKDSAPVQAALGVAIVDESVFALQSQDPGFAKLYFLLEKDLLEPRYQIKGFELPAAMPVERQPARQVQDDAAKAAWAGAPTAEVQPINSRPQKLIAVQEAQRHGFDQIGQAALVVMILIPLALWAVALVALARAKIVKRSLLRLAAASGILLLLGGCLAGWFIALSRSFYNFNPEVILILLAAVFGLGVLIFAGYAWLRGDSDAQFLFLLTAAWGAFTFLLVRASERNSSPPEGLAIVALLAYLLIPGAYLFFGQGRWVQARRLVGAVATGLGVLSALPALAILPALVLFSGGGMGAMAPVQNLEMRQMGAAPPMAPGMALPAAAPTQAAAAETAKAADAAAVAGGEGQAKQEAPRLRQFFPETLYWNPEVVTDGSGFASLEIPMADSITTWRLTALASSQDGRLGFTTRGVRVFQDFFADVDLPVSLTQGDEISIPVGVFNYLPQAQQVRLEVKAEPWFELKGTAEQTLTIASNDIQVVYFPIRVLKFGRQGFQVTAWGEKMSDAVRREVSVLPDGKEIRLTESDWLRQSRQVAIQVPPKVVPETPRVEVKIYPGVLAQVVEGLEKILRLPFG
jgi:hypothetical protein